jgi:hypothetical protein
MPSPGIALIAIGIVVEIVSLVLFPSNFDFSLILMGIGVLAIGGGLGLSGGLPALWILLPAGLILLAAGLLLSAGL